ncbi:MULTISPECIES: potassium-transporting ATPase subunit KdpC [Stenotrophomonas]|jgi:K+-transporting ATPase ATPase C chain|uniref:Potassium-transporting ATPase KdpC subunit n=1 Tax=Stenotrophomonas bentonitica TaxID=1450134 RepID=A0ABU9JMU7_9GAMM|nr:MULTISPECIES: potassium-transporting ATPase subunit KdpC [Stenotrophomonas]MDX5517758.1 potassium-transporting ATPase subunit KdpC [Stenotrophomonas sp. RG-453]
MNRSLATSVPRPARSRAAASLHLQQDSAWRPALVLGVSSLLLLGLAYAVATTSVSRLLFPAQADGSLLIRDGQVRASQLIAQPFVGDGYFQARPSAANYDPMAAAGSNMARSNPALQERVQAAITAVAAREGVPAAQVPGDLVTQSGAGMDPEISPAAAQVQVARVARSRGLPAERVAALVQANTLGPQWGVFGQSRVNVMTLNLALEDLKARP